MSTEFFNDQWRIPSNENQNKVSNYSMELDGTSSYINVSDYVFGGLSSLSISCWYNLDSISTDQAILAKWAEDNAILLYHDAPNGWRFLLSTTSGNVTLQSTFVATINTWQHLAVTYESGVGVKIYLNGVAQSSAVQSGTAVTPSPSEFNIGRDALTGSNTRYFNGQLDQLSIFDYALPATGTNSVATLYGGGTAVTNPMSLSPKPIAYYQLGDQSVSTGPTSDYLVPNNSLSGYDFKFVKNNSSYTSGDSINIPGINKALAGATSMSMTFWVYLTPAVYPNGMMFRMSAGSGFIQVAFVRYGNTRGPVWMFNMGDGTNFSGPSGSTSTAARPNFYNSDFLPSPAGSNMWWNITCTWDGSNVKVYRNGSTQTSRWGTYTGIIPSDANATAFLGANAPGSSTGLFMDGRISNVAFWRNYSLTQSEAQEVYNNGAPLDLNNFSGSAPAAWYKLNASEIFNSTSTEWSVDNNAYPSVYKSSLNFDGNNDYLTMTSTDFKGSGGTVSYSFWVKPNTYAGTSNYGYFISDSSTGGGIAYSEGGTTIGTTPGQIYLYNMTNAGAVNTTTSTFIDENVWNNIIVVFNTGNIVQFYKNGILSSTLTGITSFNSTWNTIAARSYSGGVNNFLNGELSNFTIFDTALTSTQVETIYNNGTPEASISHSPVSWWKLDNTTTGIQDSAGSNNGTNNGATEYAGFVNALAGESVGMDSSNLVVSDLQQTSGYSPYALDFDGVDDYLDFNNASANIMTNKNAISISGWFKLNSNTSSTIASNWYGSALGQYLLRYNSGTGLGLQWYIKANSNTYRIDTNYFPSVGDWVHVVGVKDPTTNGGQIRVYVNTVEYTQDNTDFSVAIANNNNSDQIGVFNNSTDFMDGSISNVAYWTDTALTQAQVTEIFNEGRPSNLNTFSGNAPAHWLQIGSNSSFNPNATGTEGTWTCLDEIGTNNAASSNNMTNDAITDGPGYSASGLGTSSIDIKGDAPYSTANGLSENMDVLDRTTDVPS